ncbi:MAG: hypothetical protein LIO86_14875 [Lachnospiraceae bacterium]|nr:hypothetical protein [Lachnospiraceae bacterium]
MLGKLIKYDMRSISRAFIPLWILAPIVSLLFGLSANATFSDDNSMLYGLFLSLGGDVLTTVVSVLFFGILIALSVLTLLFIIQRFWKGLLKEEGYLAFTLPVETWPLIMGKAVSARLVSVVSALVALISFVFLVLCMKELHWLFSWVGEAFRSMFLENPVWWCTMAVLAILLFLFATVSNIYRLYAAMALGQLFENHRVIGAFASYLGISVALSALTGILGVIFTLILAVFDLQWIEALLEQSEIFGIVVMIALILWAAVETAVYHILTEWILSTKLNLE